MMLAISRLTLAFLLAFAVPCQADKCAWDNCSKWSSVPGIINVHLVAHTHDDMGWIKTADQYYTGARPRLVPVGVQYILNTVLDELAKDPARRFCYAEAGFLHRWMLDHEPRELALLNRMITESGQLELIGGGWTQPDEAATHYVNLIDQYSLGLGLFNASFQRCGQPRVAWQIDPFGHSREHANLVSLIGHRALFFARHHYAELENRTRSKELEMVWSVSDDLKTNILTGAFLRGTYAPPDGFCFDALCADEPIVDNPLFEDYNVEAKIERFLNSVRAEAAAHRHGHVMMTMGGDFQYSNANQWFTQLDKLIAALNARTNQTHVYAFYSTPGCYLAALEAERPHLPTKADGDFFPYATSNHSYWTGYFTSKPALKKLVRVSSALLQLSRQFAAFAGGEMATVVQKQWTRPPGPGGLDRLEAAVALSTHHDAVTGTSKENVTRDYARRLLVGWDGAEAVLNDSFWLIAALNSSTKSNSSTPLPSGVPSLQFCRLAANQSICPAVQRIFGNSSLPTANFSVLIFNAQSSQDSAFSLVRIPFYGQKQQQRNDLKVLDGQGTEVEAELVNTFPGGDQQGGGDADNEEVAPYQLVFRANAPPLGFATYFVVVAVDGAENNSGSNETSDGGRRRRNGTVAAFWRENLPKFVKILAKRSNGTRREEGNGGNIAGTGSSDGESAGEAVIENKFFRLTFGSDGLLSSVFAARLNRTFPLRQQFHFYWGMSNASVSGPNQTEHTQASGAYIFRPNGTQPENVTTTGGQVQLQVVNGTLVQEARQVVAPWLSQVIRLLPDRAAIEFDWLVGPLPKNMSALESIEVVSRYTMDGLQSGGVFWTDANGRQMLKRKRNDAGKFFEGTEPVAANVYPVNSRILLQDGSVQMAILTDRSQGGTSMRDGQIELMLHRRCFWDDGWGVEEALDEPGEDGRGLVVRGRHWLLLDQPNSSAHRAHALDMFSAETPQTMAFVPLEFVGGNVSQYRKMFRTVYSALSSPLPPNVHLLTLRPLDAKHLLLRLEHFYQANENIPKQANAEPVEVNIQKIFAPFSAISAEELALAADRPIANAGPRRGPAGLIVELRPMEIRTFRVLVDRTLA